MADLSTSPRRLVIHCGVQKTGSTSLQHFLSANAEDLGRYFEILKPERGSLTRKLGRSAADFTSEPSVERKEEFVANIKAMRAHLITGQGPILMSHENLPGAMMGSGTVRTLYPMVTDVIDLLDAHLAPFVPEYVFYSRAMTQWKSSVYNQAVKTNGYSDDYATFLEQTADCGTWGSLQQRISQHIGSDRVTFFRLEDEPSSGRPGRQLLLLAGLTDAQIDALTPLEGRRNQSLNAGALEFMRLMNCQAINATARKKVARLITQNQSLFRLSVK